MRIPAEPIMPYIKTPSLYFTYNPINIIKQWLLKFLWMINRPLAKKYNISTSHFCGILFSGRMNVKRLHKILPKYRQLAEKDNRDIEKIFGKYSGKIIVNFKNKQFLEKISKVLDFFLDLQYNSYVKNVPLTQRNKRHLLLLLGIRRKRNRRC